MDIISSLEANEQLQITASQVSTTKNLVRQTIGACLTEMVTMNTLDQYSALLDKFYDVPQIINQIRYQYEFFMNPDIVKNRPEAAKSFCKITSDMLIEFDQTFTFSEHSSQELAWFTACRANDVAFVKQNVKSFASLTDRR